MNVVECRVIDPVGDWTGTVWGGSDQSRGDSDAEEPTGASVTHKTMTLSEEVKYHLRDSNPWVPLRRDVGDEVYPEPLSSMNTCQHPPHPTFKW